MGDSKIEAVLGKKEGGAKVPEGQTLPLKSELERALDENDTELARQLIRKTAEVRIAELGEKVKLITRGQGVSGTEEDPRTEKKGSWVVVNGQAIKDPVDGYMTLTEALQVVAAQNPGAKLGWIVMNGKPYKTPEGEMTLQEAIQVAELAHKEEGDPELKELIKLLVKKDLDAKDAQIKSIADGQKAILDQLNNPNRAGGGARVKVLIQDPDSRTGYKEVDAEPGAPIFLPVPSGEKGETLEEKKEKNRNAERIAEIDATKEYNQAKSKVLNELSSAATKGLATAIFGGEDGGAAVEKSTIMQHYKCTNVVNELPCEYDILCPPEAESFTCPKCGAIYRKNEEAAK